jgi:hypothetical protein
MEITITDEQKKALERSTAENNEARGISLSVDEYASQICGECFDSHVVSWLKKDEQKRIAAINLGLQYLPTERVAAMEAEIVAAIPKEGGE